MRPRSRPLRLLLAALALASCAAAPAPEPRAQRSANLSHITGTSRTIQMFLKNRYLQLLPDGTVNGTTDGNSVYTILQRATYKVGLLTIQGVSTCLYLCMDACGFHYANKDLSDDCVFEEHIEENNYNTYSRIRAGKKTFLALDNRGKARRTQIPVSRPLGNLSGYALTLTKRWEGPKHSQCPPRRHRGKLKRPPPFHRNCQRRVAKQNMRKRKHKKANDPKKKRHPKARRKHDSTTSTTEMSWDESTMSTMSTTDEFFRSATGRA
ncbi:fibroblast growth factor 22 isoform X1 [Pieris rapae]|uniref:fibroblast growth factor 22 isoform X1 n=1 Tax=Pieris rapae TaxID=64459 RepID=UPI000B92B558|nr:fibroblast growth factor 22 isoform X1 [Pieris rapae]XP_022118200.1 fibroblast growth factor 22 isoform X1 [Pieris rapae]XP_022118202.1 fibroblast growth factor 22 isoform X1 [Pieris rapae]XP_045516384.1 fibroblast growth factor 22 isoform X1 [Pieris brassicae]XP_045516385.1 fibroblast growth factor 22 isoform X1 [Pieris brassicae]XP_045516386.1 fibroblast growth factor 22 isoform X1 [Pieris brassicae]XP_045516388.1 fibroblast growth factor 22 isoform X1 [Pieris brassicae]XP_045516389.1 f